MDFGESTSLSIDVIANNNAALFYKWQVSINGADWVDIADHDSNILSDISFDDNDFDSSMAYRIMVSSDNGTPDNEADDCVQISSIATVYSLPEVSLTIPTTVSLDTKSLSWTKVRLQVEFILEMVLLIIWMVRSVLIQ